MSILILRKFFKRRGEPNEGGVIALRRPSQSISWRILYLFKRWRLVAFPVITWGMRSPSLEREKPNLKVGDSRSSLKIG